MKTKVLILALLFCPILLQTVCSQELKTWYTSIWVRHNDNTTERLLLHSKSYKEDLQVGDAVYKKFTIDKSGEYYNRGEYYCRMDGKKMMRYDADKGEEYVLYDFGLVKDQYFLTPDGRFMVVIETGDTVFSEGMPTFHFQKLKNTERTDEIDVWIENYGSLSTSILLPSELGDDIVASRLLFDWSGPLANIFYSESIQSQMMNVEKVTDYYKVIDDNTLEIETVPDSLHCEFIEDTLVISGRLQRFGTDLHYLSCELVGNTILFRVEDFPDFIAMNYMYHFTAKFPGFKQGTYTVNFDGENVSSTSINIEVTKQYDLNERFQEAAFSLFGNLADEADDDNLCFSPLSLQAALCMVENGADGNTLQQMKDVLGLSSFSDEEVNGYCKKLFKDLTTRPEFVVEDWNWWGYLSDEEAKKKYDDAYPICEIADAIWTRPDVVLKQEFKDILHNYYDAESDAVDFTTQEGIDVINNWVSDKTHGLIPTIYDEPQNEDLAVALVNALYFKGAWLTPFEISETCPDTFYIDNTNAIKTDMMHTKSYFKSTETKNFRIIRLFYGNNYSMTLFVPKSGTILSELTIDDWKSINSEEAYYKPIFLAMPKFEIDGKYKLIPVLQKMGITDAFNPYFADFSRMRDVDTFIEDVRQMSKITVDEEGTEAAAVTGIDLTEGSSGIDECKEFKVDRPFYFTIENNYTSTVLFAGRVKSLNGAHITVPATGINTPDVDDENAPVYDLSGRRLNQVPERGLYIQNGKVLLRRK